MGFVLGLILDIPIGACVLVLWCFISVSSEVVAKWWHSGVKL